MGRSPLVVTPPPSTWRSRLHFAWSFGWAAFLSGLLSPGVVLESSVRPGAETFVKWMRPWGRLLMAGIGLRVDVENRLGAESGPVVFAANHQNALDIPLVSASLPLPFGFVAKKELSSWPIVGWVLRRTSCLFIDRSSPRAVLTSLRSAAAQLSSGDSVLVFPEGGRTYAHRTQPFRRGAFLLAIEAGVPVVPVALIGNSGVLHEGNRTARPGRLRVVIGEPVPTEGMERREAAALAGRVRAWIESELARYDDPATE